MKHRRGPFSEDVRLSRDPDRLEREIAANRQRERREAIQADALRAGMTPGEIEILLRLNLDEAEQFLKSRSRGRRVRDLTRADRIRARCSSPGCGHWGWVDLDRRRWGHILLRDLASRLVCERCGTKGARLEIGPGWPRG